MNAQVLYVEDEPDYQILVGKILGRAGISVRMVETGEEGFEALDQGNPALLLLDINLPDTDGYSICRKIRREPRWLEMPILMLTVRRRPEEWLQGFGSGADDYVSKPLNPPELVERVKTCLEGRSRRSLGTGAPEHQLIQAAIAGNRAAYEVLIQQYRGRLFDYMRTYTRAPDETEDVVSRAFLQAYKKLDSFRGQSSFYTWLCRIAIREAYHERRQMPPLSLEGITGRNEEAAAALLGEPDRVGEALMEESQKQQLHAAIAQVPSPYRELLRRHLKSEPYEVIAKRLKIPKGTVMSRMFAAKGLLRKAWQTFEKI